ncbi:MAG: four helix bundle protein [Bacteroidia bacterium]|nr:four helix bundle protein [Bacteroidia bacterium]
MSIALKEANETEYWLLLLKESDYLEQQQADALINENKRLIRMLTASIKTAKNNLKSNSPR